ncbi:MAG: glycosyltransferase, partial [Frankiaceae bacterium]
NSDFFALTKRLHNRLHGALGDGGPLGAAEHELYEATLRPQVAALLSRIAPGDVVILHDPQVAGLVNAVAAHGAHPIWRCHIGTDGSNEHTDEGWEFLRRYASSAQALVFSRRSYAPPWASPEDLTVIPPALDPLSAKNAPMTAAAAQTILGAVGILDADPTDAAYVRDDGTTGKISGKAIIVGDEVRPGPDTPLVVQVSRWDALKDMRGVLDGFVRYVAAGQPTAHLALVGPSTVGVTDDPEGQQVLDECTTRWHALPSGMRRRVSLVSLPMEDFQANAAMVNAVQRHAFLVVQKSLVEGFGLTVAEAMWKARPMVATRVGGISDQVVDGVTGTLLADPADLAAFGAAVTSLLQHPERAHEWGARGAERVQEVFLPDRQLQQWIDVLIAAAQPVTSIR